MADQDSTRREQPGSGPEATGQQPAAAAERVEVTLAHERWHHVGWLVGCAVAGTLLILEIGTLGKYVGALLIALAGWHGYRFLRTLLYPAGTFALQGGQLVLPRGLCQPGSLTVPLTEIQHVFLLRRALSWNQTAPLLVIETDKEAYSYPRDWFAAESEQSTLVHAIGKRLGSGQRTSPSTGEPGKRTDSRPRGARAQGDPAREGEA